MIPLGHLLVFSVVLFWPAFLHAQTGSYLFGARQALAPGSAVPNNDEMYEDIEVMRRILDRKLHGLYPTHTYTTFGMMGMQGGMMGMGGGGGMMGMQGGMGMAGGMMPATISVPSLEGVYLRGQGVVYTATLASLHLPGKAAQTEKAKPISEWESVRRQLRNEKEEPKKSETSKPLALSDSLLQVLAENGHHFSQLGENESLTIVLTVHEPKPTTPTRKPGEKGSARNTSSAQVSGGGSDLDDKVRDLVLLGDLHMKQGRYAEAIATYQKAVELKPDSKEAATLYRKLAQCYLNLGEDAKGRALLDRALSLRKKSDEEQVKPGSPKQSAVSLPVKLIISAPKKLLDEAKDGKLTFEGFRRRARVETLRFNDRR